jgi:hypothetical protein
MLRIVGTFLAGYLFIFMLVFAVEQWAAASIQTPEQSGLMLESVKK